MKGNLRWWIIGLVTLGTILNYLARSTLSVAAPTLKETFSMSTEDYSWVVLAFQLAYTVMQTVAGGVLDALGTRLGFFIFAVGWALANMAHALATGCLEPRLLPRPAWRDRSGGDPGRGQGGVRMVPAQANARWPPACSRWAPVSAT